MSPRAEALLWGAQRASAAVLAVCVVVHLATIIYAVQVNTDGDPVSTIMQNCASDPSKFVMLTSANQIISTFGQIGTNLTQLRVAK